MMEITPRTQEILDILDEEFKEVGIIISKIRRFGINSYHPDDETKMTNAAKLILELGDVIGMLDMAKETELNSVFGLNDINLQKCAEMKKLKVVKFMKHK